MTLIRLENTSYGFSSLREDEVDTVLEFDPECGTLKVHSLPSLRRIPFGTAVPGSLLRELINADPHGGPVRVVHNPPVPNAYAAPFKIYLDLTKACTLGCPFCLAEEHNAKIFLSADRVSRIAAEIHELGVMYVKIGGGDPFLHPNFASVISLLRSAGCFITISTNSATLTPAIVAVLSEAKACTSVSIEGMEATNDRLRGAGHFRQALTALVTLKRAGVNVLLRTTLLRENLGDVPGLVSLAKDHGVKIKFSYCRPAGRAVRNRTVLGPGDAPSYMKVVEHLNSPEVLPYVLMDEGMMLRQPVEAARKLFRGRMCGAANRSMHINANGTVSPCIFLGPAFSHGEIYRDGTIREYWRGDVGEKFLAARAIRQPHECDRCERLCKNECPANRLYFWGAFDRQDPNCLFEATRQCGVQPDRSSKR